MIGEKKIIGVCMTKVQGTNRSRIISDLHKKIDELGYKIIVFNSGFEFIPELNDDISAADIYKLINFDIIDALIVFCSGFVTQTVWQTIAENGLAHHVPVILEDEEYAGCYSIRNEFAPALEKLLNHVIQDHGATDTFFVAGFKGNYYSESRLDIYKKVLAQNGLEFKEENVDYGDFWEGPTNRVMDRLFASREKMPRAIFCANDVMATTVCNRLMEKSIRIPEDVIVTGFDGGRTADFADVRVSTCVANIQGFVDECAAVLADLFAGKPRKYKNEVPYKEKYTQSCGCNTEEKIDFKKMAQEYHQLTNNIIGHEQIIYSDIIRLMNHVGMDTDVFYSALTKITGIDYYLALKSSFLSAVVAGDNSMMEEDKELMLIGSYLADQPDLKATYPISDMIPQKEEWAKDHSLYIISSLQVGKLTCGYFAAKTNNILMEAQSISRTMYLASIIVHMAITDVRQRFMQTSQSEDAHMDSLTGLPNLHGVSSIYQEMTENGQMSEKVVSVSIYEMPKYKFIYENYGIEAVEAAVCFVAEALKLANPSDSIIAHISDDSFIVINFYDSEDEIGPVINHATTLFYTTLEEYNRSNKKTYFIEVNAGCTSSKPAKDSKLENLIQAATGELYRNKLIYGAAKALKEEITTSREEYDLFTALVTQNFFLYHFQPIVDARTGEICAYEALMRTDACIGLTPIEVLNIAKQYERLYDIEKATWFNVMDRYEKDYNEFRGRKVFINCIPGQSLKEEDSKCIMDKYEKYMQDFVFEITEGDTMTQKELEVIRSIGNKEGNNSVAIDDYGTGHSNLVNLINYAPEVVKIDRFLMTDIHKDPSKQLLVQSTVAFAKMHDIKVLAEGIETQEELEKVIELGVDYIQGYYTGKPAYEPLSEIDEEKKKIIVEAAEKYKN